MKFIPLEVSHGEIFINPAMEEDLSTAGVSIGDFFILMKRGDSLVLSQPIKQFSDILATFAKEVK